jgi:hypothetical protein
MEKIFSARISLRFAANAMNQPPHQSIDVFLMMWNLKVQVTFCQEAGRTLWNDVEPGSQNPKIH